MLKPLEQFYCDTCGQIIQTPKEGWFEWISTYDETTGQSIDKEFRICHHKSKCQIYGTSRRRGLSDVNLTDFLGEIGIINLLCMIDPGPFHSPVFKGPSVKDFREFAEVARRLTIPYYEEARQWWTEATNDGYFSGSNEIYIYLPKSLKLMIEHYSK